MSATDKFVSKSQKSSITDNTKPSSTHSSPTLRSPLGTQILGMPLTATATAMPPKGLLPFDSKFAASIDSMNKTDTNVTMQNVKESGTPSKQDKTVIRRGRGRPSTVNIDRPSTSK